MSVHETALVDSAAELDPTVEVGPYVIIERNVRIGARARIEAHAVIKAFTRIGEDCTIGVGVVLGGLPQDHKFQGEESYLEIGDRNELREYATLHRASGEGAATRVGSDNLIMAYAHVGHNCQVGNHTMISNNVGLSGHVIVEDYAILGGMVGVHQYVRVGKMAIVGGYSKASQDIPPFMLADGRPAKVYGLNSRGLHRHGVPPEAMAALKSAHKVLYRSELNLGEAMERIRTELPQLEEIQYLLEFLEKVREGYGGRQSDPLGSA